jgi:hypothetical protein
MVLTATAIAILTMGAGFLTLDLISSRAAAHDHLNLLVDTLAQNLGASLDFKDSASATQVLGALKFEQQVVQGCLYDGHGLLFAHYESDQNGLPCALSASPVLGTNRGYLAATRPVELNGGGTGTIFLNSVSRDLFYRWKGLVTLAVMLLLLSFVLGCSARSRRLSPRWREPCNW